MAQIKINSWCKVMTEQDSNAYRSSSSMPKPEITIGPLRTRLSLSQAHDLLSALAEAINFADGIKKDRGE